MSCHEIERHYDNHSQALFSFLLNLLRNEADTRDILQEVFCKLAARPELLKGIREERGFLIRLAHNAAVDLIRRRTTREKTAERLALESPDVFLASNDSDEQAFRQALSEALAQLPADQCAVVHLKLWERMTFEQIAEALDIPLNTAASRFRYGIDKLRAQLRPLYDEIKC